MGLNISAQHKEPGKRYNYYIKSELEPDSDHRFFPRSGDFIKTAQPLKTPLGDGGWLKGTAETGV